jgi:hypothetical protein
MKTNLHGHFVSSDPNTIFNYELHGVTFKLRHAGRSNRDFLSATIKYTSKNTDNKDFSKIFEMDLSILVDSLLVGWEGLLDDNGKPIKFSKQSAVKLFRELPDIVNELISVAADSKNFKGIDVKK